MLVATRIGSGEAKGQTLYGTFADAGDEAEQKGINYGAHTADHAHGVNCGCGAIDEGLNNVRNAVKFKSEITKAINLLKPDHDPDALNAVFSEFEDFASVTKDEKYEGAKVAEQISRDEKVVKELVGPHREVRIVINTVKGMTVDQEYIREVTDDIAQVFAIDAWRLLEIAAQKYPANEKQQQKAYLSMLVYTLGTAGTLAKEDLPVYVLAA